MDFSLNEEQELFRGYIRKYLDNAGQTQIARSFTKGETGTWDKVVSGLSELGCTGINVPENYGGLGMGPIDLIPVLEETGRALLPGLYLETNAIAVPLLKQYGTEAQKSKYLSGISNGTISFSLAWLENGGEYNPSGIQLRAESDRGHFILNGEKNMVPDAELADHFLLPVRTGTGKGKEGISLLIVDKGQKGVSIQKQNNMDETRHLAKVIFSDVEISTESLLGELHGGWDILQEGILSFNTALSTFAVGAMDKIVEMAAEYAKIRIQFGQPIGRFQAIKHKIVDMKMELETARSLAYYANWALQSEAEDKIQAITCARIYAIDSFIRVASDNIQIHGGIGFTEEMDCQLFLKRARFYENHLGRKEQFYKQAAEAIGWSGKKQATIQI